jgi:ankyrin repeat protein
MSDSPPGKSFLASLTDYQEQATRLLKELHAGSSAAQWQFKWQHHRFRGKPVAEVSKAQLALADAQEVVARENGFENWEQVEEFTEAVRHEQSVVRFEMAVEAIVSGDALALKSLLRDHPDLVQARSNRRHRATLLHYVAANGVERIRQKTPPNAVEIANILLDAGADANAMADMYDQKCSTMSLLVSSAHPAKAGLQAKLAELLIERGASLTGKGKSHGPLRTALAFGYLETARALAQRGAPVASVVEAAGLGMFEETARLLGTADASTKHAALALAAQHGHLKIVQLLLDAGEDPNRYNPEGFHAHSTPLHQAVCAGHLEVVKFLAERGARLDIPDTIYQATPLGWAVHCQQPAVADYLTARGAPPS